VFYAGEIADKVSKIGAQVNIAAAIVIIALICLTFLVINNTVYLAIASRKKEIEIMRMMGVSDWYIKAPYVFQGVFYGFCGAIIAFIPLFIVDSLLNNVAVMSYVPVDPMNMRVVILAVLLMGIIVGAIGSMLSVKKYLQV
jgi:cell division transport system permease protein